MSFATRPSWSSGGVAEGVYEEAALTSWFTRHSEVIRLRVLVRPSKTPSASRSTTGTFCLTRCVIVSYRCFVGALSTLDLYRAPCVSVTLTPD